MYEIDYVWNIFLAFLIGSLLYLHVLLAQDNWLELVIFTVISTIAGVTLSLFCNNSLKLYYPFYLEKKLKKIRKAHRLSANGNKMIQLSEANARQHLAKGQQAEASLLSLRYEVWKDEKTNELHIECYDDMLCAEKCPKCEYKTLKKEAKEKINTKANQLIKSYICHSCGYNFSNSISLEKQNIIM